MKMTRHLNYLMLLLLLVLGGAAGFSLSYFRGALPQERRLTITAHKYAYDPSTIEVNRGDTLHIRLVSTDVTHGFYLEGYDLDAKVRREDPTFWVRHPSAKDSEYEAVEEVSLVARRAGKFRYRCSITCGYMHPFMNGILIVRPNYLYPTGVGLSLGLVVGMLWIFRRTSRETP
jgi:cytochrome c oxidase subunit II